LHALWQDLRYGVRMLGKNPGFTAIAILTLALGIGANTAIFSLLQQVLLRQLPVKNPGELVVLRSAGPKVGHVWTDGDDAESFSYPMYQALRDNSSVFSGMIGRYAFAASIANHGQTERGSGELVSGNYFEVLGVRPVLGRVFSLEDDRTPGAQPVVVLSHQYWTRQFGADPGVLNQTLLVNNTELTIVGVTQSGFTGIQVGQTPDVFVPLMMKAQMTPGRNGLDDWNDYWMAILARLKPGESIVRTQLGINATYHPLLEEQSRKITSLNEQRRKEFLNQQLSLAPGSRGRTTVQRDAGTPLTALFVMVAIVLLIACSNVANLVLAQGAARQREFAIRAALGASRARMFRQLLSESFLCAFAGGVLGLLLGSWLMDILIPAVGSDASIKGLSTRLDARVLAFAAGATLLSGLLFALIPAWRVTRTGVTQTLKDQGSTSSLGVSYVRFRKTLVAGQVAFTMLLLAGACLYTRTLWNLRKQNLGLQTENLITFSLQPDLNGYDIQRTITLIDQLRERITAIPGVRGEGISEIPTLTGDDMGSNITVPSNPQASEERSHVNYDSVSPGYFSTLGVPLLSGRDLNNGDSATSPKVAVVSESMAKIFFPNRNPIGERFAFGGGKVTPDTEIVGVVKDAKQTHVRDENRPYIFVPYTQRKRLMGVTFYVRTEGDPLLLSSSLRDVVQQIDANLPVYDVKTFERVLDADLFAERMVATLSAGFGLLAAFLAALGIYGVLAYLVLQRTREIGIRIALGAERSHVRFLIVREVGYMVLAGAVVGLPLSYGLAHLSESLLFGVRARDPLIYVLDVFLISLVALAACYLPARRATRVDPIVALRYE
jgi:putative ABC transport system permease protein